MISSTIAMLLKGTQINVSGWTDVNIQELIGYMEDEHDLYYHVNYYDYLELYCD